MNHGLRITTLSIILIFLPWPSWAGTAVVAVATNFSAAMVELQREFQATSGHELTIVHGSTGKLYAQIRSGAPFDVLLAADQQRPQRLVAEGLALADTRFTYALGHLSLWSTDPNRIPAAGAAALAQGDFRLAMANPALAPYGAAAEEVLQALGLAETLRDRIVLGENVGQAHAMVATGNAELGLVARSYIMSDNNRLGGSRWDVPADLYKPIRQDAVLLKRALHNPAARDFLTFLRNPRARATIAARGYGLD